MYVYMYMYIHMDVDIFRAPSSQHISTGGVEYASAIVHMRMMVQQRDLYIPKETYIYQKRPMIETCSYENVISNSARANNGTAKRPIYTKRDLYVPKETNNRDLFIRQCHQQ